MLDRRHFLIGAGALLTASFVNRAKAFSRKSGEPLVLSPARKPEETLYVYRQESDDGGEGQALEVNEQRQSAATSIMPASGTRPFSS